jgi:hypothetical protein
MAAGLKRDDRGAATGALPGLTQRMHLGMGRAGPLMKALAHQLAIGIQHHATHQWIRTGAAVTKGG